MTQHAVAVLAGNDDGELLASRWADWRAHRDPAERQALVLHYLPHARRLARHAYAHRAHDDLPFEDYEQLARVGLVESIDRFDPQRGVRFTTFSSKRIQGAIVDGLARASERSSQVARLHRLRRERLERCLQEPTAASAAAQDDEAPGPHAAATTTTTPTGAGPLVGLDDLVDLGIGYALGLLLEGTGMLDADAWQSAGDGFDHAPSTEHLCGQRQEDDRLRQHLLAALELLTPRQQEVLRGHYLQGRCFAELAAQLGLTRGRITQLHQQALRSLRRALSPEPSPATTRNEPS